MSSSSSRPARPLQWLSGLFGRREGPEPTVAEGSPRRSGQPASHTITGSQLRQAHAELGALLDAHPDTRQLMRHLDYVERKMTKYGSRALSHVPSKVLITALEQLERLIGPEPTEGLSALRLHVQGGLLAKGVPIRRRRVLVDEDSLFGDGAGVDVSEATPSLFDETERSWTGQMPFSALPEDAARSDGPDSRHGAPSTLPAA